MAALLASWVAGRASANSTPLSVSFAETGQELPQAQIRAAIAAELGRETHAETESDGAEPETGERVLVAVDEQGELWVRYFGPRGLVDRHLPMPAHPDQIAVVVSLAVGNLARQEAFQLLRDIERRRAAQVQAEAEAVAAKPVDDERPAPALPPPRAAPVAQDSPQNSWGHYLVVDIPYVPAASHNCTSPGRDICYDWTYRPIAFEVEGSSRKGGIVLAHARYVMTYSRALLPGLRASARVGFAFAGADAQDEAAARFPGAVSKFVPWLLEARLQHFPYRDEFTGGFRPFGHLAGGYAEESPIIEIQPPQEVMSEERGGSPIHVRYAIGPFFAGGGIGGSFAVFGPIRAELELSGFFAFPRTGWLLRPSAGATYDF